MTRHALFALSLCALPSLASADAIPPPAPIECRPGEHVVNDHGGTRCELPSCETQADCPAGTECPAMRCVGWVPSGYPGCDDGSKEPPDPCDPVPDDRGPCRDAEPRCDEGERCTRQLCVWRDEPPAPEAADPVDEPADETQPSTPPPSGGGGGCCGSRGTTSAAWPGALLSALAFVVVGHRRRR